MEGFNFWTDYSMNDEHLKLPSEVDDNFRIKVHAWCSNFMGGSWSACSTSNLQVTYIKGGLTNYLYKCELDKSVVQQDPDEPRVMLLRIYGDIVEPYVRFNEGLIFSIMSERGLGPRLYGAFPLGRFEQFYESNHLSVNDFRKGLLNERLACLIAKYHLTDMPLNKNPTVLFKNLPKWLASMESDLINILQEGGEMAHIGKQLQEMNLRNELEWLTKELSNVESPVVFCHNDLQEGNIMFGLTKDADLRLIDYEYSSYHHRGYDIGNHFCEHVFDNFDDSIPDGFSYDFKKYPSIDLQHRFADAYIKTCRNIIATKGPKSSRYQHLITTREKLIYESNKYVDSCHFYNHLTRFSLASHLYWGLWSFVQWKLSNIKWGYLQYSLARFEAYFHFKKIFS